MPKLNIIPFFPEHAEEIAKQQQELFQAGAIDSVALSFTLVPEGIPAIDKAAENTRRFKIMQQYMKSSGIPTGILLQATWGHGWIPDSPSNFQRIVRIDGGSQYTMCPEDENFRDYVFKAVATAASAHPDFIMLDDDTRFFSGRNACFCPLHTALFNKKYGCNMTSDQLRHAVSTDKETAVKMDAILQESIQKYARLIRSAIDSVDSNLFCSFCLCSEDVRHAPAVARILAGKNHKPLVRINNGRYIQDSPRAIPFWLYHTATQIAAVPDDITIICEPDTCPQNRYSTAASMLLNHMLLSALEGCKGGKIWISRLSTYEPASGKAYRKILSDYAGKIDAVIAMNPKWLGACIPLAQTPYFNFPNIQNYSGWHDTIVRMGLPVFFSKKEADCYALTASQVEILSDDELRSIFKKNVLLDGSAAEALTRRALSALCGCTATPWDLPHVTIEQLANGKIINAPGNAIFFHLTPAAPNTEIASTLIHRPYALSNEQSDLAPGTLICRHDDGTVTVTLANRYGNQEGAFQSFSMFNETRKAQLTDILNALAPLPFWYPEDGEIFVKAGLLEDGTRMASMTNISLDSFTEMPVAGPWTKAAKIQLMQPDGSWQDLAKVQHGNATYLQFQLLPLDVAILRFID